MIGVNEAAHELGVSPRRVRQMLLSGELRGRMISNVWMIEVEDLRLLPGKIRPAGRSWKPISAWAALAQISNLDAEIGASQRSRIRFKVLESGLFAIHQSLRPRAKRCFYYAHPSVIPRMLKDSSLVLGGVSAAAYYHLKILGGPQEFEGYVDERHVADIVRRYALDPDSSRPNVLLRVVSHEVWPFRSGSSVAPKPVVGVDLLENGDERVRRAGKELVEGL